MKIIVDLNRDFEYDLKPDRLYQLVNDDGQIFYGYFVEYVGEFNQSAMFNRIKIDVLLITDYTLG